ncbi:helicase-exonuclease AddAB subunit AddA [Eubacteriaceae bacterium ES3]|nr:helicase-exonuclease AddAB subunit AddA [Eubacteriaceae bacterium ES3]
MNKKWTAEQLAAIENRYENLLVSAAAGSGKTALLIERILRIVLEDQIDVDKLLVLTFTRAAAGEMKNRLNQTFSKALEGTESEDRAKILKQMSLLGNASISTFHVFCMSLLRQYFYKIDLDPGFVIGNDIDMALLRKEALEEVFELEYEKAEEGKDILFLELVDKYSGNRNDTVLKELVEQFYFFLNAQPYKEKWCEKALSLFDIEEAAFMKEHLWGQKFSQIADFKLSAIKNAYACGLDLSELEGFEKVQVLLEEESKAVERALLLFSQSDAEAEWLEALKRIDFGRFPSSKKMDPDLKKQIKDLRDQGKEGIKDLIAYFEKGFLLKELKGLKPLIEKLVQVTFLMDQIYQSKKLEKNALDYNDLEQLALKLLEDETVSEEVRNRFDFVFIDEYQDTNEMQETILKKVVRSDNYFMVGDVKQSIYRFRLADPGIFMEKYESFGESQGGALINLNRNFRSSETIINGINEIFSAIMSKELGEIDYNEKVALYPGLKCSENNLKPEIHVIYQPKDQLSDELSDMTTAELEARFIAKKIMTQIGSPLYRSRDGLEKPVEYRDIGVLLRSLAGREEIFLKVFQEYGIPVYFEGGSRYYESLEIRTILNLLNLIDNGHQDLALLSVMVSPIGKLTTDDCTVIRIAYPDGFFYEAAEKYMAEKEDDLSKRLKVFYEQVEGFREDSKQLPVEEFLWKIFMETGYFGLVGCLPGGEQRQNNLKILLKRAADYKKSTLKGLYQFVRFIESMKKHSQDVSPSRSLSEQENVVRLMTVHKSKGLEFPVVFIAGLNRNFNKRDNSRAILFHKNLGICPDFVDEKNRYKAQTIAKQVCMEQNLREMLSEEMRILYVGMTRAEEKLHLVAAGKITDKQSARWQKAPEPENLLSASCFLDWIMMAVLKAGRLEASELQNEKHFTIQQIFDPGKLMPVDQSLETTNKIFDKVDETMSENISSILSFDYQQGLKETLPGKMSVTEIKNLQNSKRQSISVSEVLSNQSFSSRIQKPVFMESREETLTGAEKGTALHLFMEVLDLEKYRKILESQGDEGISQFLLSERERLIVDRYLGHAQGMSIDLKLVQTFFNTDLGNRILTAATIKREWPFTLKVSPATIRPEWEDYRQSVMVQGVIDCAFIENGEWVIVDYKTDYLKDQQDYQNRLETYRAQVEFYAKAVETLTQIPVREKIICFIRMGKIFL